MKHTDVRVTVADVGTGWELTLQPVSEAVHQDRRLNVLSSRLCQLDALAGRTLARGALLHRTIPARSSPLAGRLRPDGVFAAHDLLRPLLMPRQVDDSLYPYQRNGVA